MSTKLEEGGMMRAALLLWTAPLAVVAVAAPAAAQVVPETARPDGARPDTLRLADAVARAREANPMLRAARLRADAAAERVPQAGALPDPLLELSLMNRMLGDLGSTMDPMTMNEVRVTQMLPWPGTLGYSEERARRLARALAHDADETGVMLTARVQEVYHRLAYMDRALAIMDATRNLLRDFLQVSSAMYAVGTGLQQDVLQAQVAVARMTADITVMAEERVAMAARLNALLGRDATVPVGALELPQELDALAPVDTLMAQAVEQRPALRAARERVAAAEAGYRAARRELYPDLMLSLSYGQRPRFDDMASLMIGFRIPLWAGSRQLPMRREMLAMRSMAEAEAQDLYNETFARLTELKAQAERARNLAHLYASAVLPQAQAAVQSAFSAYRVGQVDYMTLVENQMTVNRYEIERVRLAADYHQAVAVIAALIGAAPGGAR